MDVKGAGVVGFVIGAVLGAKLSELAEQEGITVSELLRRAVLEALGPKLSDEAIAETRAIGKPGRPRTRPGNRRWSALPERNASGGARPV